MLRAMAVRTTVLSSTQAAFIGVALLCTFTKVLVAEIVSAHISRRGALGVVTASCAAMSITSTTECCRIAVRICVAFTGTVASVLVKSRIATN